MSARIPVEPVLKTNVRAEAARTIARVMAGRSLDDALAVSRAQIESPKDQALLQAIAYGVLRDHSALGELVDAMMQKPLQNEPELQSLLLVGLFQLRSMRIAAHAAVAETVDAAGMLGHERLRGLVNALLRRYTREQDTLEKGISRKPVILHSHPEWLVSAINKDWPKHWVSVLANGNVHAPMTLRVNRRRGTRDEYLATLAAAGIKASAVPEAADAVVLEEPMAVEALPGFLAGEVSVQDASAQLAVDLLDVQPGQRVLDACAAPGGKTAHLLERCDVEVLALDSEPRRLPRVQDNLDRLGLAAELKAADAGLPGTWWDHRPFDRILIDAPCSGTGVIRRHPDIKWLRREEDITRMSHAQSRLLDNLWPLLAPGGVMLYAVCSVLMAEGEDVMRRFLTTHLDAKRSPIEAEWGEPLKIGRRIAPGGWFDGFYYARLIKAELRAPVFVRTL